MAIRYVPLEDPKPGDLCWVELKAGWPTQILSVFVSVQVEALKVRKHCDEKERAEIIVLASDNTVLEIPRSKLFRREFSRR